MRQIQLAPLMLRARLAARRAGPAVCLAGVLGVAAASAWGWTMFRIAPRQIALQRQFTQLQAAAQATPGVLAAAAPPPTSNENLAAFYGALGEQRHAEQHVKVLFDLAAKAGLSLNQGEYKFVYDKASRVTAYQVILPVKGGYNAIWQFALEALRAMPFAALDDIGFRRETVNDTMVEARVRMTLYLQGDGQQQGQSAAPPAAQAGEGA